MSMEKVIKAAAFLDEFCEHSDWRNRINVDTLDMDSSYHCVIGQIYGYYNNGVDILEAKAGTAKWEDVTGAFCRFDAEWRQYLTNPTAVTDEFNGAQWIGKIDRHTVITVCAKFLIDGVSMVTYKTQGGNYDTCTENLLRDLFVPKPTYVHGRIYFSRTKKVLIYSDNISYGNPGFYSLNSNETPRAGYSSLDWWEQEHGPMVEMRGCKEMEGKPFDVQL